MLNFFRNKNIDRDNIKNFQELVTVANLYISEKKWYETHNLLKEIKINEQNNSIKQIEKLSKTDKKEFEK
jgi:hypothetical protein